MSEQPVQKAERPQSSHMTIGVLSITAVVMLVGIFVVTAINSRAMAIGETDRGGDYIIVTSQFDSNTEAIVITDAATQQVVIYGWDIGARRLGVWATFDLKRLSRAGAPVRRR